MYILTRSGGISLELLPGWSLYHLEAAEPVQGSLACSSGLRALGASFVLEFGSVPVLFLVALRDRGLARLGAARRYMHFKRLVC
jgi:hypothetical protein